MTRNVDINDVADNVTNIITDGLHLDPIKWFDFVFKLARGIICFIFNRTKE